jgi:hypothetical protein
MAETPKNTPTIGEISDQGSRVAQKALQALEDALDAHAKDATIQPTRVALITALAHAAASGVGAMDDDFAT